MSSLARRVCTPSLISLATFAIMLATVPALAADGYDASTARSGNWSDKKTWKDGKLPAEGARVLISPDTKVTYDVDSTAAIREVHVAGVLSFSRDRSTRLVVGLLRIGAATGTGVEDVDKHDHEDHTGASANGAALEVGTPDAPIPAPHTARIVLKYFDGMDKDKAPAIVCRPGGRMDFHGAAMSRTWVELGADARPGDSTITLSQPVTGWRAGDTLLLTGTERREPKRGDEDGYSRINPSNERRTITKVDGTTLTLDKAIDIRHAGTGDFRGEAANLSRTVIVDSADPEGVRGHTMYHYGSIGSISYALFQNLGKEGGLGRYPIHFHRVGDSMRGSSVIGAAIVDSKNRWVTIHGTQYMVVRDCVGLNSVGHGYFLEDGSEVYNVLDRNLGDRSTRGRSMKGQALPFDPNEGSAFWWANGKNTFTRNVACENHEYGYRYDSQKGGNFSAVMPIRQPDGSEKPVDIRTIPIYRFQHNESHTEGLYSYVFAGTRGVGPDTRHPHVLRDLTAWNTHYCLRTELPTMLVENVRLHDGVYGVYRPWFENHVYRNITMEHVSSEPFNRGMDDESAQHGSITVDGLTFSRLAYGGGMPLIQISDNNLSGKAASHFRNVKVVGKYDDRRWPLVNLGGGPRPTPKTAKGVPVYLHDWYGPGRSAKVASRKAKDLLDDGSTYKKDPAVTGDESFVAEVTGVEFPQLLDPVDDEPPATAITFPARGLTARLHDGKLTIRGTTTDNNTTKRVIVNGIEAKDVDYNFHQWEVTLTNVKPGPLTITAKAEDAAGNVEKTAHVMTVVVE